MSTNIVQRVSVVFSLGATILLWGIKDAAAQYYFGRNKVQYYQFDWQVLSSEHLNVYYYTAEEEIAQIALHYGEAFYQELEQKFNHTLAQPIPIVIYSNPVHFQQTNILTVLIPESVGGFFEFLKERVAVPFNGQMDDFLHALKHEMVHVFFYAKIKAAANEVGAWELPAFPLWFIEGLAEHWSQGWNAQGEVIIRDAVLNDYLYPLDSFDLYESGYLLYKEGQAFLRFFEQHYGSDRIRELLGEYWRYESFEKAIEAVTGQDFASLETMWRQALRQESAAPLSQSTLLANSARRLTKVGNNIFPEICSDSTGQKEIVYLHNQFGYSAIRAMRTTEKQVRTVISGERCAEQESLHFLQTGLSVNSRGELVYVTKSGGRDVLRIVDLNTKRELHSLEVPTLLTIRSPRWSADNQRIVFSAQDASGKCDLYLWLLEAKQVLRLTEDYASDTDPCFDPTGRYLAFVSDRDRLSASRGNALFLYDLHSRNLYRVVRHEYDCSKPVWLEQLGSRIQFLATKDGVPNLWEAELPDQLKPGSKVKLKQLTAFYTGIHSARPTGTDTLLLSAMQNYNFQLYRYTLGSPQVTTEDTIQAVSITSACDWRADKPRSSPKQQPYKLRYSFDFAQTNVVQDPIFGFLGGAQVGISDILGNRYYHFLVANTAQSTGEILDHFNFAVTFVDLTRRCNRTIGWFHFANDYYSPYDGFYYERSQGIRAGMNYPIDIFRRLEFSASLWQSYRDYYWGRPQRAFLLSNYLSWVEDNTVWLPTGPLDGHCLRITVGPTFNFRNARFYNYTLLTDLRWYWRFLGSVTWAQRYIAWFNEGTDIYRFYIGGSWGLRGYGLNEVYGCKYFMVNQELRFPFAHSLVLRFGQSDLRLAPLRAAVFCDLGNAWDEDFPGIKGSVGIGLRAALQGSIVLRLDTGRRTNFRSISKKQFWQFFFGYDF